MGKESEKSEKSDGRVNLNLEEIETLLLANGSVNFVKNSLNLITLPLLILSAVGVGFILVWAQNILVPFVISVFFSYLLRPIVDFLHQPFQSNSKPFTSNTNCLPLSIQQKVPLYGSTNTSVDHHQTKEKDELSTLLEEDTLSCDDNNGKYKHHDLKLFGINISYQDIGCPRVLSVFLGLCFSLSLLIGLIFFFIDAVEQFEQNNWKKYEDRAVEIAIKFFAFLNRNFNIDGSKMFEEIMKEVKVFQITTSLVYILTDAIGYVFIIFLFLMYLLIEHDQQIQNRENSNNFLSVRKQIDLQIQRYIIIKTLISAIVGFLVYLVLGPLLNVKLANAFAVITFLANFIPNVGAIVATLLPFPILLLDVDQTNVSILLAMMLPITIHGIVGNFVEPKIFEDRMKIHAVVILLSLSLWFAVWGIPGAILAVPITAVIRIIVSNMNHPYAVFILNLLEGKMPGAIESTDIRS